MHNLDGLISDWRKNLRKSSNLSPELLDELESHLREKVDNLVSAGMSEADACTSAINEMGTRSALEAEFRKLGPPAWLPVKIVTVFCLITALALILGLSYALANGKSSLLLAGHVFSISLGYTALMLNGLLGLCFVCQRFTSNFSASRLHFICRSISRFTLLAICTTALGVVLGSVWAKGAWGHYWSWDLKETGGLLVLVWLVCFWIIQQFNFMTARSIVTLTLLGNVVVIFSWFGTNYAYFNTGSAPHLPAPLAAAILLHVGFFLLGLAPSSFFGTRKNPN